VLRQSIREMEKEIGDLSPAAGRLEYLRFLSGGRRRDGAAADGGHGHQPRALRLGRQPRIPFTG